MSAIVIKTTHVTKRELVGVEDFLFVCERYYMWICL